MSNTTRKTYRDIAQVMQHMHNYFANGSPADCIQIGEWFHELHRLGAGAAQPTKQREVMDEKPPANFSDWWRRMMNELFDYGPHEERYTDCDEQLARMAWRAALASIHFEGKAPQPAAPAPASSFQDAVGKWMDQCFIPSLYSNMVERGDRLLEEVLELLQATGYDQKRVATLVNYVFGRPVGDPGQEVGGVMITLAGFCYVAGLDMHAEGQRELDRIRQPEVMAKIRAKQEAKNALHFDTPLPGNTKTQTDSDDAWTIAQFIFRHFGDVSMAHHLTDDVVAAVRRIEGGRKEINHG